MGIFDSLKKALGLGAREPEEAAAEQTAQAPATPPPDVAGWAGPVTADPELTASVAELMGCVTHGAFGLQAYETQSFVRALDRLAEAGAVDDSIAILRRAALALPDHRDLRVRLARLYMDRYDNESSRRLWEGLATDDALAAEANFRLGEIAEREARNPDAAAHYQRALAYDFSYPNARQRAQALRTHLPAPRKAAAPTMGGVEGGVSVGLEAPEGYDLKHPLGRGGYGTVYLAADVVLRRDVAIKFLHPHLTRDERRVSAFFDEARLVARLQNPGIVRIYDLAVEQRVIVMEYMTRGTLRDRLAAGRALSPVAALGVTARLLTTLSQLHAAGVVHRDLKPSNILFRSDGSVVLGDFGVATLESGIVGGRAAGTLLYMAPEQKRRDAVVDRRADLYAVGLVLAEMLAGGLPAGSGSRVLTPDAFVAMLPAAVRDVVEPVLRALLAVEPGARSASADEALPRVRAARRQLQSAEIVPDLMAELTRFSEATGVELPDLAR
jgi:hypothetical protein